jgi:Na+/proline symporter
MGTVFSHNIVRQLSHWYPDLVTSDTLLLMARLMTFPFALTAACLAAYYRETGYLLIVAFDIVLASVVCPLVAAFYVNNPSPRAALCATVAGIVTRITLEFTLPKDGFLILPFNNDAYYDYGSAASADLPTYVDPGDGAIPQWDPTAQVCEQEKFRDFTGVDSLGAFFLSILVFTIVQTLENRTGKPLFTLPGLNAYNKEGQGEKNLEPPVDETEKVSDHKAVEGVDEEEE